MSRPKELEFDLATQRAAWERSGGFCEAMKPGEDGKLHRCGMPLKGRRKRYDHILPAALGGKPTLANCQAICMPCDIEKTPKDIGRIRLADRQKDSDIGAAKPGKQPVANRPKPDRVSVKADRIRELREAQFSRMEAK